MRPRFAAAIIFAGFVFAGLLILGLNSSRRKTLPPVDQEQSVLHVAVARSDERVADTLPATNQEQMVTRTSADQSSAQASTSASQDLKKQQIEQRVVELEALSGTTDESSVSAILSELGNPEKEIREAAREAAIQSGAREAIPRLEELIERSEDADEKADIREAIEFLKLPSLTEHLAERKASALTNAAIISQSPSHRHGRTATLPQQPRAPSK